MRRHLALVLCSIGLACAKRKLTTQPDAVMAPPAISKPTTTAPEPAGLLAAPRLFFTDLVSGPAAGGEHGNGVYLTLYGERFGSSGTVTLNGADVASIVSWSEDAGPARRLDRIVVQLGRGATSGDIVVTTGGRASNPLPFVVRPGNIRCITPTGSDAAAGSFAAPWKTLPHARKQLRPGDVVYLRGGVYTTQDPTYPGWDAYLVIDGENAASGTAERPIAWVGYPGEPPVIGDPTARRGILVSPEQGVIGHYVFANLTFTQVQSALPLAGPGHRVVGNFLHDGGREPTGMIGVEAATGLRVYGNLLASNGEPGVKFHHAFYLGGFGTQRDIDFGWNEIRDQHGGRGIQMFGHAKGDLIDDVRVHDNLISGTELDGIVIGGSDGGSDVIGTVRVTGNVIRAAGGDGVRLNDPKGTLILANNTLLGNATGQLFVEQGAPGHVRADGNLMVAGANGPCVRFGEASAAAVLARANLCSGKSELALDAGWIAASPSFRGAGDWRLAQGSPGVDHGVATEHGFDFLGIPRPQGAGWDVGAFESY